MKSSLTLLLFIGSMLGTIPATAQKGYWVVESNINTRNFSIVRIYDMNNQLVKETNLHRSLDITRSRDRRMLDRMLKISFKDHEAIMARKSRKTMKDA